MRNSIYELSFDELMLIREEICDVYDRYWGEKEPTISRDEYLKYSTEMLTRYDIHVRVLNKIRREYYYAACSDQAYQNAKARFERHQKPFLQAQKREQAKLDLLKEQMRKELIAELGL